MCFFFIFFYLLLSFRFLFIHNLNEKKRNFCLLYSFRSFHLLFANWFYLFLLLFDFRIQIENFLSLIKVIFIIFFFLFAVTVQCIKYIAAYFFTRAPTWNLRHTRTDKTHTRALTDSDLGKFLFFFSFLSFLLLSSLSVDFLMFSVHTRKAPVCIRIGLLCILFSSFFEVFRFSLLFFCFCFHFCSFLFAMFSRNELEELKIR